MPNTKLKVVATIQARMGSTRLRQKALMKIKGKTLIEWIAYRLSFCKEVDQVVLSTVDNKENDPLADLAEKIGLEYFRGSENDLISRLHKTAKKFSADAIVRITGDCPLVDPTIVDRLIREFRNKPQALDHITNIFPPTYPDGMDVEVMPASTLQRLDKEVKDPLYRDWITVTIMENPNKYKILNVPYQRDLHYLRLTVDYPEDFELTEIIFKKLHKEGEIFIMEDILGLFKREPALIKINEKRVDKKIVDNIRSAAFHGLK